MTLRTLGGPWPGLRAPDTHQILLPVWCPDKPCPAGRRAGVGRAAGPALWGWPHVWAAVRVCRCVWTSCVCDCVMCLCGLGPCHAPTSPTELGSCPHTFPLSQASLGAVLHLPSRTGLLSPRLPSVPGQPGGCALTASLRGTSVGRCQGQPRSPTPVPPGVSGGGVVLCGGALEILGVLHLPIQHMWPR